MNSRYHSREIPLYIYHMLILCELQLKQPQRIIEDDSNESILLLAWMANSLSRSCWSAKWNYNIKTVSNYESRTNLKTYENPTNHYCIFAGAYLSAQCQYLSSTRYHVLLPYRLLILNSWKEQSLWI